MIFATLYTYDLEKTNSKLAQNLEILELLNTPERSELNPSFHYLIAVWP